MNEKIFTGYIIKGVSRLSDLETVLYEIREAVLKRACLYYKNLVIDRIERNVDDITLNRIQRPSDLSILDFSANEVQRQILYAEHSGWENEFNLYMGGQILVVNIDGNPETVLRVMCPNEIYEKDLLKIKELVPLTLYGHDIEPGGSKEKIWQAIVAKYEEEIPISCSLLNYNALVTDPVSFTYKSPEERAGRIAREQVLNGLLSSYACGGRIEPERLAEYAARAAERFSRGEIKERIGLETQRLVGILPTIDFELVTKIGAVPVNMREVSPSPGDAAPSAQPTGGKGPMTDTPTS